MDCGLTLLDCAYSHTPPLCPLRHEQKEDSLKGETEGEVLQMASHVIMSNGITCHYDVTCLSILYNTETQGFIHAQSGYIR